MVNKDAIMKKLRIKQSHIIFLLIISIGLCFFLYFLVAKRPNHLYAANQSCGNICDATHSCGLPITINGKITDYQGKGIGGISVVVYDHNRDNNNYPTATDTVITDANGNFSENGLVCGVPSINYGDAYAIRPNWFACIDGFMCISPKPGSYENQQSLKTNHADCNQVGGCNFAVKLQPVSRFYAPDLSTTFSLFGILAVVALVL